MTTPRRKSCPASLRPGLLTRQQQRVGQGDGAGLADGVGLGIGVGAGLVVRGPVVGAGRGGCVGLGSRVGRARRVGEGCGAGVPAGCVGPGRLPTCPGDAGPDCPAAPVVVVGAASAGSELDNEATAGPPAPGVAGTASAPGRLGPLVVPVPSRPPPPTRIPTTTSTTAVAAPAAASGRAATPGPARCPVRRRTCRRTPVLVACLPCLDGLRIVAPPGAAAAQAW
jgi:hypothetical protein